MSTVRSRASLTFSGGVHPPDYKHFSEDCAIKAGPVPKQVCILLSQHIGAICQPIVNKKDAVAAGQKIGQAQAFVSAAVHSPVKGIVKDIVLKPHPVLGREMAVVIDAAEDNVARLPQCGRFHSDFSAEQYSCEQIVDAIREAGIVGMGGAGFPAAVKAKTNPSTPIDTIIVNGCECEPFITCDYRIMIEWTAQILAGVKLVSKALNCKTVYIAIEDNKPKAVAAFRNMLAATKTAAGFEVKAVKTKYPQGGERQLIKAITGKDVPTGGIPPMIGAMVVNVATAAAIAEAVVLNMPLTHRVVTVSGRGIKEPANLYVPVGISVGELIDFCGGVTGETEKIVLGGPMMGFAIADLSTPITKTSGAIIALTAAEIGDAKSTGRRTPCIRCGRCIEACPVNLNPTKIAHAVKGGYLDVAQQYFLTACIECGCCSYVCPANIELTGYIKTGKILLARQKQLIPK